MTLLLNSEDVRSALPLADAVEALEQAFLEWGLGRVKMPPRPVLEIAEGREFVAFMPAALTNLGSIGAKIVSLFKDNPKKFNRPSVLATGVLLDGDTGALQCVMDAGVLTAIRTSGVSAVATRRMARPESRVAAVIGSGVQGAWHVRAMLAVRPIEEVRVYSPNLAAKWEAFAASLPECRNRVLLKRSSSVSEAVRDADIVCLATTAVEPLLAFRELRPGVHLNVVGSHTPSVREIDTETVIRSRLVCESVPSCLREAGDILIPIAEGKLRREAVATELADVLLGRASARDTAAEATLFKSTGLAFEDVALMKLAYDRCLRRRAGTRFDFSPSDAMGP